MLERGGRSRLASRWPWGDQVRNCPDQHGVFQMAYAEPYTLTKLDIAALKACDYLWFGLGRDTEEFGHIDLIKRAPDASEKNPFPQEARRVLKAPVTVRKDYRK